MKEEPLEPLHRDPAHLHVNTTLGMNLPPAHLNAQLNILLGPPPVTGRLVGGKMALPEGMLVGQRTPNLILRTPGTKTRDSAKACTRNLYSLLLGLPLGFAWLVNWLTFSAAMFVLSPLSSSYFVFFTHALAFTLVQSFLLCTGCVWGELYLILVSNSPNSLSGSHLRSAHLPLSFFVFHYSLLLLI